MLNLPSPTAPAVLAFARKILELMPGAARADAVQAARLWVAGSFQEVN